MKEPADQQYPPNLLKAIHSTFHFLKKYKALLTSLKEPNSVQNASLSQNVRHVLQRMHSDFDRIEQNIESEELKYELGKIVSSVLHIEEAPDLASLHASLQSLSSLTPVFSKILLELEVLSKVDIQDVDSVECFIAFLQSLNTLRTLQGNVRNFQSSSNTDSIQIPMLLSFLGSCERLEIKVSELLSIVENCAEQNVKLDSQFYKRAIEAFTILNNQLIHLNKCLIDQSMSDDNQKEIPFEMSINAFTALLSTIDVNTQNDLLKEVHSIINVGITDELKRLRNDILFNMSLIQSEDEITFNDSEQYEDALPGSNPDLVSVCLKSMKDEVRKCGKHFDKMNRTSSEQKVGYIDSINTSLENMYNILNFINRNVSLEGGDTFICTLREPVLRMLQQTHKIEVFVGMGEADCTILPMLIELNQSFEKFKSLLAMQSTLCSIGTSSSEASSSVAASNVSPTNVQEFQRDESDDITDSIYNDLSSSTESADYTTVKPNQIVDLSISEASVDEKSLAVDSSSPSSDILSDLKLPREDSTSPRLEIMDGVEASTNDERDNESVRVLQFVDDQIQSVVKISEVAEPVEDGAEKQMENLDTKIGGEEHEESTLHTNETSGYHSKTADNATATDHSLCSTITAGLEEKKHITQEEHDNIKDSFTEILATEHEASAPTVNLGLLESMTCIPMNENEEQLVKERHQVVMEVEKLLQDIKIKEESLKISSDKPPQCEEIDDVIETSSNDSDKTVIDPVELAVTNRSEIEDSTLEEIEEEEALRLAELQEKLREEVSQVESLLMAYEQCKFIPDNDAEYREVEANCKQEEGLFTADLEEEQMLVKVEFPEDAESANPENNFGTNITTSEIIEDLSLDQRNEKNEGGDQKVGSRESNIGEDVQKVAENIGILEIKDAITPQEATNIEITNKAEQIKTLDDEAPEKVAMEVTDIAVVELAKSAESKNVEAESREVQDPSSQSIEICVATISPDMEIVPGNNMLEECELERSELPTQGAELKAVESDNVSNSQDSNEEESRIQSTAMKVEDGPQNGEMRLTIDVIKLPELQNAVVFDTELETPSIVTPQNLTVNETEACAVTNVQNEGTDILEVKETQIFQTATKEESTEIEKMDVKLQNLKIEEPQVPQTAAIEESQITADTQNWTNNEPEDADKTQKPKSLVEEENNVRKMEGQKENLHAIPENVKIVDDGVLQKVVTEQLEETCEELESDKVETVPKSQHVTERETSKEEFQVQVDNIDAIPQNLNVDDSEVPQKATIEETRIGDAGTTKVEAKEDLSTDKIEYIEGVQKSQSSTEEHDGIKEIEGTKIPESVPGQNMNVKNIEESQMVQHLIKLEIAEEFERPSAVFCTKEDMQEMENAREKVSEIIIE
jgi:hypothetical protein